MHKWLEPDGVSAIATTIASILALASLVYVAVQQRDIRREQRRIATERLVLESAARRAQAAQVVAYTAWEKAGTHYPTELVAAVINASGAPIYDATVIPCLDGCLGEHARCPVVAIGAHDSGRAPVAYNRFFGSPPPNPLPDIPVIVTFVDDAGLCWYRDERGRLHEGSYEHPAGTPLVPWD
ncbi:hypothetical protein [Pseudofrankia sp. BMG5.37]|uniref:hypothetical protein n=1 Tax=Pseudofrankia sp. BMG5.37 TaxID=3050035 RepID=UPI0028944DCA|nr:hypothetical protein [Pseudofrankia sp. BMG5.37]MDT3438347.1 hypothetical protein [Pseudofrankia sp. BMG5.37]